ncbi:MAG: hypothetical protein J6M44_05065 [Butyrivibrio sp.]|uniref:hypothetical protein n=1 Tax=Butyrivibrio sp. TaxID=28121 RepID=UPI001B57D9C6|nr:hypothetical protein [Butyrivibrio sp.]MBP3278308.1 hypothetical protein [Butyrivibrio sp.]MBP3781700.1 hypothetical protein [Butyrivibrio sp.]
MSYRPQNKTNDSLNNWFSNIADFINISPNLLKASSLDSFKVWFEKLEKIDRRSLYLFLKKHKDEIPKEYLDSVRNRFQKEI